MQDLSLITVALYLIITVVYNYRTRKQSKDIFGQHNSLMLILGYVTTFIWVLIFHHILEWYIFNIATLLVMSIACFVIPTNNLKSFK